MPLRRTSQAGAALLWLALSAAPVAADCDPAGPLEDELRRAPVAFVGRVVQIDGSVATFEVAEVWKGDAPARVQVHGLTDERAQGPGGAMLPVLSEDDRGWEVGADYLVVPFVDNGVLRDHICTATAPWTPELAAHRPADARAAEPPAGDVAFSAPLVLAGVGVAAILGVAALAFRRR